MQDFVIVEKGSEGLFIAKAKELGFDSLVLLYRNASDVGSFTSDFTKSGLFLDKKVFKDFSSYEYVVALGTSFDKLPKGVTHVVCNEFEKEKDFIHQRRSGVNHVFLAEFKGVVLFAYAPVQQLGCEQGSAQVGQVVGRFMQNSKLCKNWKVVSLAENVDSLRACGDVKAFSRILEKKPL